MELGPIEAAEGHDESGAPLGGTPQFCGEAEELP